MKLLFFTLLLPFYSFANSESLDDYISKAQQESIECHEHIKGLLSKLKKVSEAEAATKERDYDFPKEVKEAEEIINAIDPYKIGNLYLSRLGIEARSLKYRSKDFDRVTAIEPCLIFEHLELFKALAAAYKDGNWPESLKLKAKKKVILFQLAYTAGTPVFVQTLISLNMLKVLAEAGMFKDFASEINLLNRKGEDYTEEHKGLILKSKEPEKRLLLEVKYNVRLSVQLHVLLLKILEKELLQLN